MDLFERIEGKMNAALGRHAEIGHGYFTFPKLEGDISNHMKFRGKDVIVWSLNNYIGLANHPEVRKTDSEAAAKYGFARPMGSRMLTGNSDLHEELEKQLAVFVGKEYAVLLNYGYQGMISAIQCLVDRRDVIVYDQLAHACIVDGKGLHIGKSFVYAHNDIQQLTDRLEKAEAAAAESGGGILVITEGVFGMKGDLGKLNEIVALKKKYNFRFLVDDAHGFGTMGKSGAGTAEHFGVTDGVDILFNTFAKSMAMIGGFIAGNKMITEYLRYQMRSLIYAKSMPMPLVVGALKRLELLKTKPELRENLWKIVRAMQGGLRQRGFDIGITQSPVTPVYMKGGEEEAAKIIIDLRENYGIFVSVVTYPVVEKGELMLRIIPTAVHTLEDVEKTLNAFEAVRRKMEAGVYSEAVVVNGNGR